MANDDKPEALALAKRFDCLGYMLVATEGTGKLFADNDMRVEVLDKISESENNPVTAIRDGRLQIVINTTQADESAENDGRMIRNTAIENAIPLFTNLDTVSALLRVLETRSFDVESMK
ncbi:Carbamoyl-phosphate synthase large chain [Weissella viridescens]|uniref:carbamoyl-phosphate synthase (glutamine-hydrolyzing) n=1 Tax=Weissella viridescens TaxID=1629 RepID=A0A380NVW2_WEIVI|nr:Carbamoyl-phosphate synthase large chain [Weissella viridescens]